MTQLSLRLLGGFRAQHGSGRPLAVRRKKAQALLAYLALHLGAPSSRDSLAGLLWSGTTDEHARHNLRQTLFALRQAITPDPFIADGELVGDGKLDAARPEALIYEPKGGKLELVGVEYIVIAAAWDAANKTPPTLMGQLFHLNSAPNRYGIPAFYALHVWAWRHNPQGTFVDYNSRVSCDGYPTEAAR